MNNQSLLNQTLRLKVKRLGINGEGIAYYKKTLVFIPYALPKETVLARVTKVKRNYVEATLVKFETISKERVKPRCPHYAKCGGCQLQHLSYEGQLTFKADVILQALERYYPKGAKNISIRPTIGMDEPYFYRNKLQFQLRYQKERKMGLFQEGSHTLVPINDCCVQDPLTQEIANHVFQILNRFEASFYDEKTHRGLFKTLMVRVSKYTREAQVVLITTKKNVPQLERIVQAIAKSNEAIISIMQNVQPDKTSLIMGEETIHLWGKETIREYLEEQHFDLSARSFFQLNTVQTERLYEEVRKALQVQPNDTIIDAYCGVGTIGLSVAPYVKAVYGMDIIPSAIENAKKNAQQLENNNTHYEAGKAEVIIQQWVKEGLPVDGMIVDPPRTGLDDTLLDTLQAYPIPKLVYVSCNPSTLAKDLNRLSSLYEVQYIQSVDMFPQTARAEAVVSLTRKN